MLAAALPLLLLPACSGDGVKKTLREYVEERSKPMDIKYRLVSYEFTDTITVAEAVDSLCAELPIGEGKPDSAEFRKMRNREFAEFHPDDPDYEEKIMRGEYRDVTEWTKEVRLVTERADSLLACWDRVTRYSYDYNYLYWWYQERRAYFYDKYGELAYTAYARHNLGVMEEARDRFAELDSLLALDGDAVFRYVVLHRFSIYNPLFQTRIELEDRVYLNDRLEYVGCGD